jgi:antitoxin HicB
MKFTVVLQPESDGGYSVTCPAIAGCVSQGETREEVLANIREAIGLCLEVLAEEGRAPPAEKPELVAQEVLVCLRDRAREGLPLTVETAEVEVARGVAV